MNKPVKDIRLIIDGEEITGWTRWEVESDFLNPADGWSCSIPIRGNDIDWSSAIVPGMTVKVVLDGSLVMRGRVDGKDYSGGMDSTIMELTGRDEFLHLVDCDADPGSKKSIDLITLARDMSSPWSMDWQVQPGITLKTHKRVKIEPGEKRIDVLQRIAKKEKLLFWYGSDGVANIGRPDYDQAAKYKISLWHTRSGKQSENNILPGWSVSTTWNDRYKTITVAGTSGNDSTAWGRTSHRRYMITDSDLTVERPLIITDGDIKTIEQAKEIATLKFQEQVMESKKVNCSVKGHYASMMEPEATPEIWEAGNLAAVTIEPAGIKDLMWLSRRRLILDESGPKTELEFKPIGWMS